MQLCHFAVKISVDNGKLTLQTNPNDPHSVWIEFTSEFSNDSSPSSTSITIHGLTRQTASLFTNGATVALYAGFYNLDYTENNVAYIMGGTINQLQPLFNDSGDWQLQFNVQDGANYDNIQTLKNKVSKAVRTRASNKNKSKLSRNHARNDKQITQYYAKRRKAIGTGRDTAAERRRLAKQEKIDRQKELKQYHSAVSQANLSDAKLQTSKKKWEYKPIHFPDKTKGKTIIQTIARKAGIKIKRLELKKNRVFKHGYTANKKPFQCLQDVANDCNTDVMYVHGGLSIAPFAKQKKLAYKANKKSGLINPPQLQVDDNSDTNNSTANNSKKKKKQKKSKINTISPSTAAAQELKNGTYQATIALNPMITTGSIFRIDDKLTHFSDWVIVTSGEHSFSSGSTPTTQVTFELYSKYKKDETQKFKTIQSQEKTKELAKDKSAKNRIKAIRKARTAQHRQVKGGGIRAH